MTLDDGFNLLATAPDGIKRLRELILSLAVQGKLVPQDPNDEPASELLKQIRAEKDRLIAEGKIKKDKPLPAIGDDEKPFALPEGWEWVRLEMLYPEFQNGASSRGDQAGIPTTVLRLADIKNGQISFADTRQISINDVDIEKYRLQAGDVLITRVNGSAELIGRFAIYESTADVIYCDHFIRVRLEQQLIKPAFLRLLGDSELVRTKISSLFITTAGQKTVNQGHINSLLLTLPPLAEQSRIVAKVEELMALCDALETRGQLEAEQHARLTATLFDALAASESAHQLQENWARLAASFDLVLDRPQAVDALEQTILQLAVRGLLVPQDPTDEPASELLKQIRAEKDRLIAEGKIKKDKPLPAISDDEKPFDLPQGWEWVRLGGVAEFINGDRGKNYPSREEYVPSGMPWINTGHIEPNGTLSVADMNFITKDKFDSLRGGKIQKGDLVYCLRGATFGKTALVEPYEEGAIASSLMIIRPIGLMVKGYIYRYLISSYGREQLFRFDNGSAQPNLSANNVKLYVFPVPPLAEQARIVARVEALRALCGQLRQRLAASRDTQGQLASALLAQG